MNTADDVFREFSKGGCTSDWCGTMHCTCAEERMVQEIIRLREFLAACAAKGCPICSR
jgi:hypothetical protein